MIPIDRFDRKRPLIQVAGACECKPGYSGYKCDQCAAGYRQFPGCMPCPCDSRGILPSHDCEGDCLCKANVAGELCDRCKPGYFALTKDNLDGCLPCYCFDRTDRCTTARLSYSTVSALERRTDLILRSREREREIVSASSVARRHISLWQSIECHAVKKLFKL